MRFWLFVTVAVVLSVLVSGQEIPKPGTTLPPTPVQAVKAVYTSEARAAGIEGEVRIDVIVLTDGTVSADLKVVQSLDSKFGLDDEAVKASKQWKFKPATKDGKPVTAHVVIEHTFALREK